jgi:hypothetical protein
VEVTLPRLSEGAAHRLGSARLDPNRRQSSREYCAKETKFQYMLL